MMPTARGISPSFVATLVFVFLSATSSRLKRFPSHRERRSCHCGDSILCHCSEQPVEFRVFDRVADSCSPVGAGLLLPPDNPYKFRPFAGMCVNGQDVSNPPRVELVLQKIGLQWGGFWRFQAVIERAVRDRDMRIETCHLPKILGIVKREFLPVEIAHRRMRFHHDPRLVAVDATHERAGNGGD